MALSSGLDPNLTDHKRWITTVVRSLLEMNERESSARFHLFIYYDYKPPSAPPIGSRLTIVNSPTLAASNSRQHVLIQYIESLIVLLNVLRGQNDSQQQEQQKNMENLVM